MKDKYKGGQKDAENKAKVSKIRFLNPGCTILIKRVVCGQRFKFHNS